MNTSKAKVVSKASGTEFEFDYTAPETLPEAIETDGEEKVLKLYLQERKTSFLDYGRSLLVAGKTAAEAAEIMKTYKLGDRREAAPRAPVHIDVEKIKAMSAEERTAQIAKLMAAIKDLKAA